MHPAGPSPDLCPLVDVIGVADPEVTERLAVDGFARVGPLLTADEVGRARAVFDEMVRRLDRPLGDAWFPTILLTQEDVREFITTELGAVITPRLAELVDLEAMELMRLDFSVKPPSPLSGLGPHQDFSLVDERRATSLYLWIPLEDTDATNGTLHVVPGSHRFSNRIRSQHVPATFDDVIDLVEASAVRLDCQAGELVLMVSGVVHYSPPNLSTTTRVAAHGILTPSGVPLEFYFADEQTPDELVECYEMDLHQYVRHIHRGRPDASTAVTRLAPRPTPMTRSRFERGLAATRDSRRAAPPERT